MEEKMLKSDTHHKIHLEKEKETLLITLYAKALDYGKKHPILNDQKAAELVEMIDYDFENLNRFGNRDIMVVRAKQLDKWLFDFLKLNATATVINLGCGLDTRVSRINPQQGITWFDVDYPEVIEVRKLFYSNSAGYQMIASSVTEPNWFDNIPKTEPVIVIAEGILEYLTEAEVKILFNRITDTFPHGQIAFDVMNSFAIKSGKEDLKKTTGAEHKWAVDHIQAVEKLDLKFKKIKNISILKSKYMRKMNMKYRLLYAILSVIPNFRNMIRLLMFQF